VIVVSDTSPINNLAAINQLHLLQQLYEIVFIPEAVYRELVAAPLCSSVLQIVDEEKINPLKIE
jgi:predicted nucleic acid-binding protein